MINTRFCHMAVIPGNDLRSLSKVLFVLVCMQALCFAQSANNVAPTQPPTTEPNCPVEVVKMNPSHESFWNDVQTSRTYGTHTDNAHNKFLEVKVKNLTNKTIRGIKFVTAFYDSTEDLTTIPHTWGLHGEVKAGEIGTGNWDTNAYQKEAAIGWIVLPWKILFTDGTTWQQPGGTCSFEWWKNKKHPPVNKAPNLDGIKNDTD